MKILTNSRWFRSQRAIARRDRNHLEFFQNFHADRDGTVHTLDGTEYNLLILGRIKSTKAAEWGFNSKSFVRKMQKIQRFVVLNGPSEGSVVFKRITGGASYFKLSYQLLRTNTHHETTDSVSKTDVSNLKPDAVIGRNSESPFQFCSALNETSDLWIIRPPAW